MDSVDQALLERAPAPPTPLPLAPPKPWRPAATKPQLSQQERVISTAYLAMIVIIVVFLAVTGLVAWLGA
jgi:hypothetical protein